MVRQRKADAETAVCQGGGTEGVAQMGLEKWKTEGARRRPARRIFGLWKRYAQQIGSLKK